jgi:hypothetical protein
LKEKIKFIEKIIDAFKDKVYFTTLGDFNTWWTARNQIYTETHLDKDELKLTVHAPKKLTDCVEHYTKLGIK